MKPGCYAGPIIGGCGGPLTEEHPFSEALRRGGSVEIVVREPDSAGEWQTTFSSAPIKAKDASAKILCADHNNGLSPTDQEAVRLQDALQEIGRRDASTLVFPSQRVVINGRCFAQFLCKYIVGAYVIHDPKTPPSADLVRYAFGFPTSRPLHFYSAMQIGDKPGFGRTDNAPVRRIGSDTEPSMAYVVEVAGLRTIVTHLGGGDPLLVALKDLVAPDAGWLDRLCGIRCPMKGNEVYFIAFDWSDDPAESRLLDAGGLRAGRP